MPSCFLKEYKALSSSPQNFELGKFDLGSMQIKMAWSKAGYNIILYMYRGDSTNLAILRGLALHNIIQLEKRN
jgi:hypothetical protein